MPKCQRYTYFFIAVFFVLGSPQLVNASKSETAGSLVQLPVKQRIFQGVFVISTFQNGKWVERGRLGYDRFFTARKLDLSSYLESGDVRLRVIEKGGEAAYIDSILLGGGVSCHRFQPGEE